MKEFVDQKTEEFDYFFMNKFEIKPFNESSFKNKKLIELKNGYLEIYSCHDEVNDTPCLMRAFAINNKKEFNYKLSVFISEKNVLDKLCNQNRGCNIFPAFYGGFYQEVPGSKGVFSKLILVIETGHHSLKDLIDIRKKMKKSELAYSAEEALVFLRHIVPSFQMLQELEIFHGGVNLDNIVLNIKKKRFFLTNFHFGSLLSEETREIRDKKYSKKEEIKNDKDFDDIPIKEYFDFDRNSILNDQDFYPPEMRYIIDLESKSKNFIEKRELVLSQNFKFNPFKYDMWALGECLRVMVGNDQLLNENTELAEAVLNIIMYDWGARWDASILWEFLSGSKKESMNEDVYEMEAAYLDRKQEESISKKESIFRERGELIKDEKEMSLKVVKSGNLKEEVEKIPMKEKPQNPLLVKTRDFVNKFFSEKLEKATKKGNVPVSKKVDNYEASDKKDKKGGKSFGKILDNIKEGLKEIESKERNSTFKELFDSLVKDKNHLQSEPVVDRISIDSSANDIMKNLKKHGCSEEFFETVSKKDLIDIVDQIENVTGFNLITNSSTEMKKIKISANELESINLLINGKEEIRQAFIEDLANFYKIDKKDLKIRILTSGSLELLLTIPAIILNKLTSGDFPTLAEILKKNGIEKFSVEEYNKLPDPKKAVEMLKAQGLPITIQTKEKESVLREKFGPYLPAIAALAENITIKYDEKNGELKIFGTQEAKASVQHYLIKIDNILNKIPNQGIVLIEQKNPEIKLGNYNIWLKLYDKAKEFALEFNSKSNRINPESIEFNKNLKSGQPSAVKFISGLISLGFKPEDDINSIFQAGCFAWHGTKSVDAIRNIAANNLDQTKRNIMYYGVGEYFGKTAQISQGYWGDTNIHYLFFFF